MSTLTVEYYVKCSSTVFASDALRLPLIDAESVQGAESCVTDVVRLN